MGTDHEGSRSVLPCPLHLALSICLLLILAGISAYRPVVGASSSFSARALEWTQIYQGLFRSSLSITYPILGLPAHVEPGGDLTITVVLHQEIDGEWEVRISIYSLEEILPVSGVEFENGSWILTVPIPETAMSELYDLRVGKGEVYDVERHAVSVGEEKDTLTLIHITDTHLGRRRQEVLLDCIDLINLIRPDLVVITGDVINSVGDVWNRLMETYGGEAKRFGEMMFFHLEVPVYLTPGNHDGTRMNPPAGYYPHLNPYPDYAFDFGPVRFISLDQRATAREIAGSYTFFGNFTDEQLDFLDAELSGTEKKLTTIMFHAPQGIDYLGRQEYTLALAGDWHWDLAVDAASWRGILSVREGRPFLLVTGAPPLRGGQRIRIIRFDEDRVISCSYLPENIASTIPPADMEIEVQPAKGGQNYQRLEIENNLMTGFPNAFWTFNLSNPGPGWELVVLGGSLERTFTSPSYSIHRVSFDVDEGSKQEGSRVTVECLNLVPTTQRTAEILGTMIGEGIPDLARIRPMVQDSTPRLAEVVAEAEDNMARARTALDAGNWTEAATLFSRADHVRQALLKLEKAILGAELELDLHEDAGLNVSLVRNWLQTILTPLGGDDLYPSLNSVRLGQQTTYTRISKIIDLSEDGWSLADEITRVDQAMEHATAAGLDTQQSERTLRTATDYWWKASTQGYEASYSVVRSSLDTIYEKYPGLFQVPEASLLATVLLTTALLGKRRAKPGPSR